jgi:hypothetical protein
MGGRLIIVIGATRLAVKFAGNRICDVRELLLLFLEVFSGGGSSVLVEPVGDFLNSLEKLFHC